MKFDDPTKAERILLYGTLLAGAIIFAFPFLWMLATSIKTQRELGADHLRVFPTAPLPRDVSPYIAPDEYREPERPDLIPPKVWAYVAPELEKRLTMIVDRWSPRCQGFPATYQAPNDLKSPVYQKQMVRGLMKLLSGRISDTARRRAVEVERRRRISQGASPNTLYVTDLTRNLSDPAIEEGAGAILADAEKIVNEDLLEQVFTDAFRHIALGDVRVRTSNYRMYSLNYGPGWRVAAGPASLVPVVERGIPSQEVRLHFAPDSEAATFSLDPDLKSVDVASGSETAGGALRADSIDRLYVTYRSDGSWAKVDFEVIRNGRRFVTTELTNLADSGWVEQQLRWPSGDEKGLSRRPFQILHPAGPAPAGSPEFAVRVHLRKVSPLSAWMAKLTRQYRTVFKEIPYGRYILTSFALSLLNIVLAIFSCTLVAYAFARLNWPGRDICFGVLLATMMIPPQVTMIPGFLVVKWLGWYNTLLPLWAMSAFGAPFFIFLLRQFLKNIPKDLEDSARIDGCGFLRIYWHVMLPLVKPTIAVIAIYTFMGVWNNFMGPLIYVNDERLFPLALGMFKFQLRSGGDMGLMMAGSFLMTLPILLLFFFLQRYFIQGISLTGMKG